LGLSLDLMIPPLSLLALLLVLALASTLPLAVFSNVVWPLGVCAIACALFAAAVAASWLKWGRDAVSLASLLSIPGYVLRKLPLYARFLSNRQKTWIKTTRD
jgi:bacteriorhodopsin